MDQVENLEKLKSIKRKARASYNCLRAIYTNRLTTSLREERKVFSDAIDALDAMFILYEQLKTDMRSESLAGQIKFAEKWDMYISCIETITAYKTEDKYLLRGVTLKETYAKEMASRLWLDYSKQLQQNKQRFSVKTYKY